MRSAPSETDIVSSPNTTLSDYGVKRGGRGWKLSTDTLLNPLRAAAIVTGLIFGLRELGEL